MHNSDPCGRHSHIALEGCPGNTGGCLLLVADSPQYYIAGIFTNASIHSIRNGMRSYKPPDLEAQMQKLSLIIAVVVMVASANVRADVQEHDGPYGLKAVIVERYGEKLLAWKLPNKDAKLLFIGTIYDGRENLSQTYERKLLGINRLTTEAVGIKTNEKSGQPLYIFFDPVCETCTMLFKKFEQEPPPCPLLWVPINLSNDAYNIKKRTQWLVSSTSNAANLTDYVGITKKNYDLLKWLRGGGAITVPTFVWVDKDGDLQVKASEEMTNGRLEQVIDSLEGK